MNQTKYSLKIIERFVMSNWKSRSTPCEKKFMVTTMTLLITKNTVRS